MPKRSHISGFCRIVSCFGVVNSDGAIKVSSEEVMTEGLIEMSAMSMYSIQG